MSPRSAPFLFTCLATLCGCLPLFGQGRGYHMELSDGSSGWAILVNDSQKTIEAYHFSARCLSAGRMKSATEHIYGGLDREVTSRAGPPPGSVAGIISHRDALEPGARTVSTNLLPHPSGCVWDADFDAFIYADGSYEGDEMRVGGVQARRDGVAEGVKYWANRLAQEAIDKASLDPIRADAERLKEEDRKKTMSPGCGKLPLACQYWRGRSQMDGGVALDTRPWKDGPYIDGYGGIIQMYARHEKKIEADVALKKLDAVFPLCRRRLRSRELKRGYSRNAGNCLNPTSVAAYGPSGVSSIRRASRSREGRHHWRQRSGARARGCACRRS